MPPPSVIKQICRLKSPHLRDKQAKYEQAFLPSDRPAMHINPPNAGEFATNASHVE